MAQAPEGERTRWASVPRRHGKINQNTLSPHRAALRFDQQACQRQFHARALMGLGVAIAEVLDLLEQLGQVGVSDADVVVFDFDA